MRTGLTTHISSPENGEGIGSEAHLPKQPKKGRILSLLDVEVKKYVTESQRTMRLSHKRSMEILLDLPYGMLTNREAKREN